MHAITFVFCVVVGTGIVELLLLEDFLLCVVVGIGEEFQALLVVGHTQPAEYGCWLVVYSKGYAKEYAVGVDFVVGWVGPKAFRYGLEERFPLVKLDAVDVGDELLVVAPFGGYIAIAAVRETTPCAKEVLLDFVPR